MQLSTIIGNGGKHGVEKLGMKITVENSWDKGLKTESIINRH